MHFRDPCRIWVTGRIQSVAGDGARVGRRLSGDCGRLARSALSQVITQSFPESLFANGFTDLVSVIPPGAKLTPSSKIPQAQVGKVPGKRLPNGLRVGYNWRKPATTAADVRAWMHSEEPANVGLRADRFPGVDIDVMDDSIAQIITQEAHAFLGAAPVRTGKAPKCLLLYRAVEPFGRMRLWFDKDGQHHLVEILGMGQEFLVHGIHPQTLQPYTWDTDLASMPATDLTTITRTNADAFLTKLAETLALLGLDNITREGDGRPITHTAGEQAEH